MKEGSAKNCGNGEKKSETPLPQRSDPSVVSGVEASLPLSLQKTPSSLDPANAKPTHPSTLLQILKKVRKLVNSTTDTLAHTHTHRTWRVFSSSNRVRSASCMSILVVRRVRRLDPHGNQSFSILFSFPILLSCLLHAQRSMLLLLLLLLLLLCFSQHPLMEISSFLHHTSTRVERNKIMQEVREKAPEKKKKKKKGKKKAPLAKLCRYA